MKKARLNPEEIDKFSTDAWKSVLKAEQVRRITITPGNTIRIDNCESHQKYSASQLEWKREEKCVESAQDESDVSDIEEDTGVQLLILTVKLKPSEFYTAFVDRTPLQCQQELQAPQRSQAWLDARKYCITASQFGSAAGLSPYQTSQALLVDKLWNTFQGNAATDWGTFHENHAKESFCSWLSEFMQKPHQFREENLMKFSEEPWMAVSPDGLVEYEENGQQCMDLVEFKCPAFLRNTKDHPYAKWPNNIPPQYLAQIQGIMGYLNSHQNIQIRRCWFVVWQPHQTWITLVDFDQEFYDKLHDVVKAWYFQELLPAFTHQANGLINYGETKPCEVIVV